MRRISVIVAAAVVLLAAAGCARTTVSQPPGTIPASIFADDPAPTMVIPGSVSRVCVDPVGDAIQSSGLDLAEVRLRLTRESLSVTYSAKAGPDYDSAKGHELILDLWAEDGSEGAFRSLTAWVTNKSISADLWTAAEGETDIYDFAWDIERGTYEIIYPRKYLDGLGKAFRWSAHMIYNYNGHDECGTTEQSFTTPVDYFVYH